MNIDNETKFEEHIEAALLASPLYIKRTPGDFDIKRGSVSLSVSEASSLKPVDLR